MEDVRDTANRQTTTGEGHFDGSAVQEGVFLRTAAHRLLRGKSLGNPLNHSLLQAPAEHPSLPIALIFLLNSPKSLFHGIWTIRHAQRTLPAGV